MLYEVECAPAPAAECFTTSRSAEANVATCDTVGYKPLCLVAVPAYVGVATNTSGGHVPAVCLQRLILRELKQERPAYNWVTDRVNY